MQSNENQGNVKDNRYIIDNYITVINFFLSLIDFTKLISFNER